MWLNRAILNRSRNIRFPTYPDRGAPIVIGCSMKITQDVRDYAATLSDPDKHAVAGGAVGMSVSGVIEDGMAQMSQKFKEMGGQVYLDAEKVSNRVL